MASRKGIGRIRIRAVLHHVEGVEETIGPSFGPIFRSECPSMISFRRRARPAMGDIDVLVDEHLLNFGAGVG